MMDKTFEPLIRLLAEEEVPGALDLAWRVFAEFESPAYAPEGTEEFRQTLKNEEYLKGIVYYGAFDEGTLVGMLGIRAENLHVCFCFVERAYQRMGVGTKLFERLFSDCPGRAVTLNAAPYGLPFYRQLGFVETDREQTVNGIRFTPMERRNNN